MKFAVLFHSIKLITINNNSNLSSRDVKDDDNIRERCWTRMKMVMIVGPSNK